MNAKTLHSVGMILVIVGLTLTLACQRGTQFGPEDTAALENRLEADLANLQSGDIDALMSTIVKSPRPLFYWVLTPKTQGWDEVRAEFERISAEWTFDSIRVVDAHHKGEGQLGVTYGEMEVTAQTDQGPVVVPVRFTRVYGKRPEGEWELMHSHTSVISSRESLLGPATPDAS